MVGTKQYKEHQLPEIKYQIESIMNITKKIKNSLTIFKPHPAQNIIDLKNILKNFKKTLGKLLMTTFSISTIFQKFLLVFTGPQLHWML